VTGRTLIGALLALVLAGSGQVARAAPATPRELYAAAVAREQALRAVAGTPGPPLKDFRAAIGSYDAVVRQFPTSGYVDNALWQGAGLAGDAFERFGEERDRSTARRMLRLLVSDYPTTPFVAKARDVLKRLDERPSPSGKEPAAPPVPRTPRKGAVLRAITRTVMPDRVRVTLELDAPVIHRSERVENPARVLFDLDETRPGDAVPEGTLSYTDDIVRRVRIGVRATHVTRVVLDLDGVARYSVSTFERPYRIVVDCVRLAPPARGAPPPSPGGVTGASPARPAPPPASTAPAAGSGAPPAEPQTAVSSAPARQQATPPISAAASPRPGRAVRHRPLPVLESRRGLAAWGDLPSVEAADPEWLRLPLASFALARPAPLALAPVVRPSPASLFAPAREPAPPAAATTPLTARAATPGTAPAPTTPKPPAGRGPYSLARQLGLGATKIVIDPGHGGHDPGALGAGISEADVVLDVALRLEALLRDAGVEVVLTRRTDEFIPLEERPAIATREQADLFLSIHANASRIRSARGIESYVLNFSTDPNAEAVAARENSATGRTMNNLPEIVKAITLNSKLDESRTFAADIQRAMAAQLNGANAELRNHGVKQAPFVVLIGASMPSVLVEISFITNPQEGRLLKTGAYRQRVAQALFDAVRGYQKSLKNVQAGPRQ
jgi:N-acetylmuramoyl-L-alanine amidase